MLARAIEAKLEFLRKLILHPEQTAWQTLGAAAAAAPASPPAAILAAARGVARGGQRQAHTPPLGEPIPSLPPRANRIFSSNRQDFSLINFKAIFEGLGLRV